MKIKCYYGADYKNDLKPMYAVITGQMSDGSFVYTKVATREDGSTIKDEHGEYVLLLDEQYIRTLKRGCQTFFPL